MKVLEMQIAVPVLKIDTGWDYWLIRYGRRKAFDFENLVLETTQTKTQEGKKNPKDRKDVSELWENFKQPNLCIIRVSKESGRFTKKYLKN